MHGAWVVGGGWRVEGDHTEAFVGFGRVGEGGSFLLSLRRGLPWTNAMTSGRIVCQTQGTSVHPNLTARPRGSEDYWKGLFTPNDAVATGNWDRGCFNTEIPWPVWKAPESWGIFERGFYFANEKGSPSNRSAQRRTCEAAELSAPLDTVGRPPP